jgi:hypothetical protein
VLSTKAQFPYLRHYLTGLRSLHRPAFGMMHGMGDFVHVRIDRAECSIGDFCDVARRGKRCGGQHAGNAHPGIIDTVGDAAVSPLRRC